MPRILVLLALLCTTVTGTALAAPAQRFPSAHGAVEVVRIAQGLEHPWSLAFLPDGRLLVSERPGRLRLIGRDGTVSAPLAGVPAVSARGQGGLLDIALAPDFAQSQRLYFCYAEARARDNGTTLAHARLTDGGLTDLRVIFRQQPSWPGQHHFGCRIVFAASDTLYLTLGDRNSAREHVQSLDTHIGKIVRLRADGSVPADNPYVGIPGVRPEIWSVGHRNVQGAALHPQSGRLWAHEHGPRGGDEVNVVRAGYNYGWPVITYGEEYFGGKIGEGTHKSGMEQPVHYWVPSIAPSGMAFYTAERFPAWRGNLFVGSLKFGLLVRLTLDGERVVGEERLLEGLGQRIRDVRQGPDGYLYLLTDASDGAVLRVGLVPR
ncbi:Glucose/arabinose dehydrogenase, beta-propeller fold [Fontimonas thermophila]|uniref:Glucose/arabinose dehydrogenase, beta-propeller fold n=1 Tax=Fontimonas thermophila TaxID=1076937 RepID=A0A1I2H8T4_9GAMM|nr:PQQ-dependent sugar dehydrogenase [Fontimonas thermophila]SFF25760.1 Glucose/arabinose dehydrogenase, beta-propeller fold [Fontimonas thermophila]